jgi:hypothetical protein
MLEKNQFWVRLSLPKKNNFVFCCPRSAGGNIFFLLHFTEKMRNCAVHQIIIVSLSWYVFLQNYLTAFMNTPPIHSPTLQRLCRLVSTILVLVFVGCATVHAQESLPVKDYSVGNQFVYSVGSGSAVENVVADTLINGVRYGIVESSYGNSTSRYYMRSTETAVYQYDTTTKQEYLIYTFGQSCSNNLGINWLGGGQPICGFSSPSSSPLMILYGNPNFSAKQETGGFTRVAKPYGITEYDGQYCHFEYFQGHLNRPPQYSEAGWFAVCYRNSSQLVSGVIRGKSIYQAGANPTFVLLHWAVPNSQVQYGQTQRVSLLLTNMLNGLSANQLNGLSVRCLLTLDTALFNIIEFKTNKGNRPDSIKYSNGKANIYCSFSVIQDSLNIGYIDIKSKATTDTTLSLAVENYFIDPAPTYVTTSTLTLSLHKPEPVHLRWISSTSLLNYSQTQRVYFRCSGLDNARSVALSGITSARCRLALDTSLVDIIEMQTAKGNLSDSVSYNGRKKIWCCTFSTDSNNTDIGFIDIRSKSPIDTVLSLVVDNPDISPALVPVTTSIFSITLQKLKLTFFLYNYLAPKPISYGERRAIVLGMQSSFYTYVMPPLSYTMSLDTSDLDSIQLLSESSDIPLAPRLCLQTEEQVYLP